MADILNAKKTETGMCFRIWNTNGDEYITKEMSEEEVRRLMLWWALNDALDSINKQITMAKETGEGTRMCQFSKRKSIEDPW